MASKRTVTSIHYDGPFFRKDPGKTFRQNVRVMMRALSEEGQQDVQTQLRHNEGRRAPIARLKYEPRVSQHVVGRVKSLKGKVWAVTAVVSVNNRGFSKAQGISLMAAAANTERQTHAFRRTTSRLRKAKKVNAAELLKGLR